MLAGIFPNHHLFTHLISSKINALLEFGSPEGGKRFYK